MEVKVEEQSELDLESVKGVEIESVDLNKLHKKEVVIESVKPIQVNSEYTLLDSKGDHLQQWVLKVSSGVLETLGKGEDIVEFRASELFNLVQNKEGKLTGFPKGDGSNLMKFVKDLRIDMKSIDNLKQLVEEIKGKSATVKAYDKGYESDGKTISRTYLKFLY